MQESQRNHEMDSVRSVNDALVLDPRLHRKGAFASKRYICDAP